VSEVTEVTVKLDLDAWLARYGETINEDGDREVIPVTLEDVVVDKAATRLFAKVVKDQDGEYLTLRDRVKAITDDEIRTRIAPMIEEAIATPLRKTNTWGEPTGETTTLRDVIVAEAQAFLNRPADQYAREKSTVVQAFIRQEVAAAVKAELADALAKAKAEVFGAVKANAASIITEVVRQAVMTKAS
jgi:hypothetical protein